MPVAKFMITEKSDLGQNHADVMGEGSGRVCVGGEENFRLSGGPVNQEADATMERRGQT